MQFNANEIGRMRAAPDDDDCRMHGTPYCVCPESEDDVEEECFDLEPVSTVPEPCEHGHLGPCEDCATSVVAEYERNCRATGAALGALLRVTPPPCMTCGKPWSPLGRCCRAGGAR